MLSRTASFNLQQLSGLSVLYGVISTNRSEVSIRMRSVIYLLCFETMACE